MAIIWFIFIIFPCHCAVYMYKITILQKPLSQFSPNFTLILLLKFRNHLAEFHQISHWSFCWNVFDSLFKWSCSIDCQAHIFFFKTKNCSNDDIFISCDDRTGKMLHNICMSAVAMSLRWANCGPWASCFLCANVFANLIFSLPSCENKSQFYKIRSQYFCTPLVQYLGRTFQKFRIAFFCFALVTK